MDVAVTLNISLPESSKTGSQDYEYIHKAGEDVERL